MIAKLISGAVVLFIGGAAGAAFGLWWVNASTEDICVRMMEDCGAWSMPLDECVVGRQQDLLHHGVLATTGVTSCLAKAPRDCLSATACVLSVETN